MNMFLLGVGIIYILFVVVIYSREKDILSAMFCAPFFMLYLGIIVFFIGGFIYFVVVSPFLGSTEMKPIEEELRIELQDVIKEAKSTSINIDSTTLRGKALIWDIKENRIHNANTNLPQEIQFEASDFNNTFTLFLYEEIDKKPIGTYYQKQFIFDTSTYQQAYTRYINVYVVYFPEKKIMGKLSFTINDPEQTTSTVNLKYDSVAEIAKRIGNLPRSP